MVQTPLLLPSGVSLPQPRLLWSSWEYSSRRKSLCLSLFVSHSTSPSSTFFPFVHPSFAGGAHGQGSPVNPEHMLWELAHEVVIVEILLPAPLQAAEPGRLVL